MCDGGCGGWGSSPRCVEFPLSLWQVSMMLCTRGGGDLALSIKALSGASEWKGCSQHGAYMWHAAAVWWGAGGHGCQPSARPCLGWRTCSMCVPDRVMVGLQGSLHPTPGQEATLQRPPSGGHGRPLEDGVPQGQPATFVTALCTSGPGRYVCSIVSIPARAQFWTTIISIAQSQR